MEDGGQDMASVDAGDDHLLVELPCDEDSIDPGAEADVVRETMKGEPSQMENAIAT